MEVKSLGGSNFVRPERVIAVQTTATGATVIVLDGGTDVNCSESTKIVADRIDSTLLPN